MVKQVFRQGSSAHCMCFSRASYGNSVVNDWYLTRMDWKRCLQLECSELFFAEWCVGGVRVGSGWHLCGMVLTTLCRTYLMVTLHLSSDWKPPVPPFARYTGGPLIIRITCYPRRFLSKAKCMYLWVRFPLDIDVQLVDAGPHNGQSELFLIRIADKS